MPTTYSIVPIPFWYFADQAGLPLGGGSLKTSRSFDKNSPKSIFTDSSGTFPWPNPLNFNANGELPGMLFWANDEPYFIQIYTQANGQGEVIYQADNYGPAIAGGGGGGGSTTNAFLENYIPNNNFLRQGGTAVNFGGTFLNTFPDIKNGTVIAPSNHEGFVSGLTGQTLIPYAGPDITYVRSISDNSTDSITFGVTDFDLGSCPLNPSDITPEYYVDVACTVAGTETLKCVQFPIDLHVKNLEQTPVTAIVWAKGVTGTQTIAMNFVQYFGTNAASAPVSTAVLSPISLAGSWTPYVGQLAATPSVGGKVRGHAGDDAVYLQVILPVNATFRIYFTKPKFYVGAVSTFRELQTYDYVNRIISAPRCGDVRTSLNAVADFGWVAANDGSIGTNGATATNLNRANIDTWPLYKLIYTSVLDNWATVSGGRTAPGNDLQSAYTDFVAAKTLTLTRTLGRVLASGNAKLQAASSFAASAATDFLTIADTTNYRTGTPVQLTTLVGSTPLAINTVYYAINNGPTTLLLASTLDNAYAGTPINITVDGTGFIQTALGAYFGESAHTMTTAELVPHSHIVACGGDTGTTTPSRKSAASDLPYPTNNSSGTGIPFNVVQPTSCMNVFLKL